MAKGDKFYIDNTRKLMKFISLTSNGDFFFFDLDEKRWKRDNSSYSLDLRLKEVSEDDIYLVVINNYIHNSYTEELERGEADRHYKVTDFGKHYDFYKFGKMVCAVDENSTNYKCSITSMVPTRITMVDSAWKDVSNKDFFDTIKGLHGNYEFSQMELYTDELNYVHGFSPEGRHFLYSPFTCDVTLVEEGTEALEDWIAITEEDFNDTYVILNDSFPKMSIYDLKLLNTYIDESVTRYNEKHAKKMLPFLRFVKDIYGCVYAMDEEGNEFICKEKSFTKVKDGTIQEDFFDVPNIDAYSEIIHYNQRLKAIHKGKVIINDLLLYEDNSGVIWGIGPDKNSYYLSEEGDILPLEDNKKFNKDKKIDKQEAVLKQATIRYNLNLKPYIDLCRRRLKIRDVELGNNITFYTNDESIHKNVYAKDDKNNEFKCDQYKMVPVPKGSIKENFRLLPPFELHELLQIVVIVE